jgi:redox-sensitive bicupin YhaK (pirin superfamily)
VQLIQGELDANGTRLHPGDAVAISKETAVTLAAAKPSDFLLFDLN